MFSAALALIIILLCYIEYLIAKYNKKDIKCIIEVNGSRGKSSITRLIAGALRENGIRTVAKVTGTNPRLIDVNGVDHIIQRTTGHVNIAEQLMTFKFAKAQKAEAVVAECMALIPRNQKVSRQMTRAQIAVITNVRADHLDIMGPRLPDVARAFSATMAKNGFAVTAQPPGEPLDILKDKAKKINCKLSVVNGQGISNDIMKNFSYLEHKDNVATVLEVCRHLNIPQDVALRGMFKTEPDPGVLRTYQYSCGGKSVEFINALAANDPDSLKIIWDRMVKRYSHAHTRITLVNSRKERMHRSLQLTRFVHDELFMDYLLLVGDYTHVIKYKLLLMGVDGKKIIDLNYTKPSIVVDKVLELVDKDGAVFAIGNIGGMGHEIIELINQRCQLQWSKQL